MTGTTRARWANAVQRPRRLVGSLCLLLVALTAFMPSMRAQEMPDPKQMSGIPRPVTDLPNGSLSVRLIKGDLSNNIAGHPVELKVGEKTLTVKTDEAGRAQFDSLPAGETLKATAVVDGERLESQEFPAPSAGGIRLMLVATDKEREAREAAAANAPAISGQVVIGGESRIVMEPSEDTLSVYYILEILNNASAPVNPPTPFVFDMPAGMIGTAVLQGSSPRATNAGERVTVEGPFPPGKTVLEVGGTLQVSSETLEFSQRFPALYEQPVFIAKREGAMRITSPQFDRIQEITAENGTPIIAGAARAIQAGQTISFSVAGLPHYSNTPRTIALSIVAAIVGVGLILGFRAPAPDASDAPVSERRRLIARREKLMQDLVRLEQEHRRGRIDDARHQTRRDELLTALEQVYGALEREQVAQDVVAGKRVPAQTRTAGA